MTLKAEEAALVARDRLGIGQESPVPDLLRLVEDEDSLRVFILPIEGSSKAQGKQPADGAIKLSDGTPFVLLNISNHPVRIRFTLAHEYGHYVLNHGSQVDIRITFDELQPVEASANRFAAELLMPRPGVNAWLDRNHRGSMELETVVRLAYYFNVSVPAAHFRLVSMDRLKRNSKIAAMIDEQMHLPLATQMGLVRAQDSIVEASRRGAYVPAEMTARIARLLERGLIGKRAAAARLRIPDNAKNLSLEEVLSEFSGGNDGASE